MSSRVGTAIPASPSTAWSSAAVGLTISIQTALSGSAARSTETAFFREDSEGTNTENMGNSGTGRAKTTQQDLARFWQALRDGDLSRPTPDLRRPDGAGVAVIRPPDAAAQK